LFKKVSIEEIENIKKRLETELKEKNLPIQRRREVDRLIAYIETWLEWRAFQDKKRIKPNGYMIPTKDFFKLKGKNIGVFPKGK